MRRASRQLSELAEDASRAGGLLSETRTAGAPPPLQAALGVFNPAWADGLRVLVADIELASESLLLSEREYLARDDDVASRLRALGKRSSPVLSRSFVG